jgi:ferredoxin
MVAARKFGMLNPVHTSNFLPVVDEGRCNGCGKCANVCPVEAMAIISAHEPHDPKAGKAQVTEDICLGCGVCVRTCPRQSLSLRLRQARVITPLNSTHRVIVMAIERGDLQNLIFDNRVLWNHRALAAVLGVVLRLPPAKQVLASQQMKSRYLEYLIKRFSA